MNASSPPHSGESREPHPADSQQEIQSRVRRLRKSFGDGKTRPLAWRKKQLQALLNLLSENAAELAEALKLDLGKTEEASLTTEIPSARNHVQDVLTNLQCYTAPQRVPSILATQPSRSFIQKDPLGLVLVISPWNFPLELSLGPLAGAIAAGNCVILKPSEVSAHTSTLLARLLRQYLDSDCLEVVEGAVPETTALLHERFDHILYTGNGAVGRIILRAAAEHLTPVTLELGGKCPAIVDQDLNLNVTARRLVWGKFFNCGQVCVAPDYLLVQRNILPSLLKALKAVVKEFYGADARRSPDYGRIINQKHHRRLMGLLLESGARVECGGDADESERYIAPTLLTKVDPDSSLMQEEIFGPLLPILPYDDIDEAIDFVNARPKPLALYYFGSNSKNRDAVLARTSSGGAAVNQILFQMLGPHLPFGGVGESGMGAYHGQHSVDTFSHQKSVLERATFIDPPFPYPPSTPSRLRWLRFFV